MTEHMQAASMPPWTQARATFSAWGGMFQDSEHGGWSLAVVDPRLPLPESRVRVRDLEQWVRPMRRLQLGVAAAVTVVCGLLCWLMVEIALAVPPDVRVLLASLFGLVLWLAFSKACASPASQLAARSAAGALIDRCSMSPSSAVAAPAARRTAAPHRSEAGPCGCA